MQCVVQDTPLFYESYGEGIPLLSLHGFTCDHRLMTGCIEPLFVQRCGWQRLYLDLPGMGQTPGKAHIQSTDDILNVVLAFIDAVIPGRPFALAGESYGGYLSRGIVHRMADRVIGMALICPAVVMNASARDLPPRRVIAENPAFMAELAPADAEAFGGMAVVQDRVRWERFRDEVLCGIRMADMPFLQKISERYGCSFDVDALPEPFAKPVLMLTGRQDHAVGYQDAWRLLENYPRATFAVLDRGGHNVHIEQPQLFNALMGEWLDRVQESMR